MFPDLLKGKIIQLTTIEFGKITEMQTYNVLRFLKRISKKLDLECKIVKREVTKSHLIEIKIL